MYRVYYFRLLICLLAALVLTGCSTENGNVATRYAGQTPPGLKAELFAPGIVSTPDSRDRDICISPDFKELYFTRNAKIMVMNRDGDQWSEPKPAPFGSGFQEYESFLSPDNQHLYYISQRPLPGSDEPGDFHIWTVARTSEGWGQPRTFTEVGDYYPSITSTGVMYFSSDDDDICRGRLVDGQLVNREELGDSINTSAPEYNACIAPDESFLIFTTEGRGEGFGGRDMFISFRSDDDHWTTPRNMGLAVNSSGLDYCPSLSPDGKYLFFARRDLKGENVYWIDASIIDSVRMYDMDFALGMYHAVLTKGAENIADIYDLVREKYAVYRDFDGDFLIGVADRLLGNDRADEAVAVMNLCFDKHPEAATSVQLLKLAAIENNWQAFDETAERLLQKADTSVGELQINVLGYRLIGYSRIKAAAKVFKLNIELFPESGNVYDSYAEVLLMQGDTTGSIEHYRKSLEKNPENTNAETMIERLLGSE